METKDIIIFVMGCLGLALSMVLIWCMIFIRTNIYLFGFSIILLIVTIWYSIYGFSKIKGDGEEDDKNES